MFDHTGPTVARAMCGLNVEVFAHLETNSLIDVDKIINSTQGILRGPALNKYKMVLAEFKESKKGISGY